MSHAAVCIAVKERLQIAFDVGDEGCDLGFDGQPIPSCGELYIAVHPLSMQGISGDYDLGEEYQVGVTITRRMGYAPKDRWGPVVWADQEEGLEDDVRKAIVAIHQNQQVRISANNRKHTGGGYVLTGLFFLSVDAPTVRGPSWFSAADPPGEGQRAECGVSQTIRFGRCQLVQNLADMD